MNFQDIASNWHVRVFGPGRATRALGRKLLEEAAEFFTDPCEEEAADILICLYAIAGREGWDLEKAFMDKMMVLEERADSQVARDTDRPLVVDRWIKPDFTSPSCRCQLVGFGVESTPGTEVVPEERLESTRLPGQSPRYPRPSSAAGRLIPPAKA